jgi:hypothetical protein
VSAWGTRVSDQSRTTGNSERGTLVQESHHRDIEHFSGLLIATLLTYSHTGI